MKKLYSKERRTSHHNISPIISLWEFFQTLKDSLLHIPGPILHNFIIIQDFMAELVTCKNGEIQSKNERPSVAQHQSLIFQLTL